MAEVKRRKVLVFIDWFLPGLNAGGPVRTCANMVERLKDEFDFSIVTRDTDLKSTIPYPSVVSNSWNIREDGTRVYYFSNDSLNYKNIEKIILEEKPDAIHLNSLFSYFFTIIPLNVVRKNKLKVKVVAGPRGMLSRGALAIKPLKKKIFLAAVKLVGLFKNVTWHASTPVEQNEIYKSFGRDVNVKLGIDLAPAITIVKTPREKLPGTLRMFYLGRISPVKNPLQCLVTLKNINSEFKIAFDIFGPVEDENYWNSCKDIIAGLPKHITVRNMGLIENEKLNSVLPNYHFLFLLSENENYGHAIVESLVSGCPVIIADRTPWRNLEKEKAGFDLPLENQSAINNAVVFAASMNQEVYNEWSEAAYSKALQITGNSQSVEDNKNLFR